MITTILEEAVNGYVLTIYGGKEYKQVFVYEHYYEAITHRASAETDRRREVIEEVARETVM